MRYLLLIAMLIVVVGGCTDGEDRIETHDAEIQRQVEDYDRQTQVVDEQLARSTRQADRYDALLDRWEAQADRYDRILDAIEKTHDPNHTAEPKTIDDGGQ